MNLKIVFIISIISAVLFSCTTKPVQGDWIKGTEQEQSQTIEKHFRGLDVAMVEIGYRYQELYWAGREENWDNALYQLDKIKLSLEQAIERRPLRKPSASWFLENDLSKMKEVTLQKDTAAFNDAFPLLTIGCNSCHVKEKVSFFRVQVPTQKNSVITK
jgi:hypothetical protein